MEIFHAKRYTSAHQYFNEEGNTQTKNDYYEGGSYGLIIRKVDGCCQVIVSELSNNTGVL